MKLKLNLCDFLEAVHVDSDTPVRVRISLKSGGYSFDKLLRDIKPEDYFVYSYNVDCIYTNLGDNIEIVVQLEADA